MAEISVVASFEFNDQSKSEIDSIASTFSVLNSVFGDTNKEGNVFLQNLKNLNVESSFLQKNISDLGNLNPDIIFTITADDRENVLGIAEELQNNPVPTPVPNPPPPVSFESEKSTFEFLKERASEIHSQLEQIAPRLKTIFELSQAWLQNQNAIVSAIAQILVIAGAVSLALSGFLATAPFSVLVGTFIGISALILTISGDMGKFINNTISGFNALISLITLTDEQLQGVGDSLKDAAENAPDLEELLPREDFNMNLKLGPPDPEIQKKIQEEIDRTNESIDQQSSRFGILEGAIASANGHLVAGAGAQSEFLIATENTAEQLENEAEKINDTGSSLGTLISQSGTFVGLQEQVNQTVGDGGILFEDAGTAAEGFGETVENLDTSGGFFEGFKDGFVDFVESVGESGELIANFFANTLSQISKNFSDLLFNVFKGNFDSLGDLAEQAFDSILKSFLDLVSAIATKQIVVSIGGLFGIGGNSGGGGDIGLIWENEAVFFTKMKRKLRILSVKMAKMKRISGFLIKTSLSGDWRLKKKHKMWKRWLSGMG